MASATTAARTARTVRTADTARTRRTALAALALATVLTATGCGASGEPGAAADAPSAGSATPTPTRSVSPTPTPTPTPTPSLTAPDGTDTGACVDGDCEVLVTEPVTIRFEGPGGPATLAVTEVGPNEVEYAVKSGSGRSKGGASGPGQGCRTVLRENGSGNSCGGGLGDTRPSPQPGAVLIQLTGHEDGTALLHMVSP